MNKFLTYFLAIFAGLLLASSANAASNPKGFIEDLSGNVVKTIKASKTDEQKMKDLVAMFNSNVDSEFMGKFAMGKFFRTATPEQQKKFLKLYRDYVVYLYIPKFKMYTGETIQVTQVIKDSDDLFTVKSNLKTNKSSTGSVLVDYKVKKVGNGYKIIDIIGEGISLITTQRSDFATPLQEQGIDDFIARLSAKVDNLKKNPDFNAKPKE